MKKVNTEKMDRIIDQQGREIAFGKVQKNEWGEYVVKVYVDGVYDEDKTIYAESRKDAEETKEMDMRCMRDYHRVPLTKEAYAEDERFLGILDNLIAKCDEASEKELAAGNYGRLIFISEMCGTLRAEVDFLRLRMGLEEKYPVNVDELLKKEA